MSWKILELGAIPDSGQFRGVLVGGRLCFSSFMQHISTKTTNFQGARAVGGESVFGCSFNQGKEGDLLALICADEIARDS